MHTRRTLAFALLLAASGITWSRGSSASGEVIAVIVNKSNQVSALSRNDLRPIFQTSKKTWDSGQDVTPINLLEDSPVRNDFDQAVLGLEPDRVARYWTDRKVRGGARPPARVPTSGAMLKAVAAKAGAVGYVRLSEVNGTVKVVAKISGGKLGAP